VLRNGWVIVGSLPTTNGTSATALAGCLIVLDASGKPVETFSGAPINGPWDMTADDDGLITTLYFTNVLNGTVAANGEVTNEGTVVRMTLFTPPQGLGVPLVLRTTIIGSGFAERTDPNALVIGPTGVGLGKDGTLYVADTLGNRIQAIPNAAFRLDSAGTGTTVSEGGALNGPLGLAIAPNRDILTVNSNDGNLVETTPAGVQTATTDLSPDVGAGVLFGLAVVPGSDGIYFVNDNDNTLDLAE
jgi:sugar lactone lactonase YvrE